MKLGRALLGLGDGALDRLLCVLGTVAFSQIPEFMQQYLQRLGGHLDEARRHLEQFRATAAQSGLSLDHLIQQTASNPDSAVAKLSGVMSGTAVRVQTLESAQAAIQHASVWSRPFVFLEKADPHIAAATWGAFRPAVPTTLEGAIYAAVGMLVVLSLYHVGVRYPVSRALRRRHAATAPA